MKIEAKGIANLSPSGNILDVYFLYINFDNKKVGEESIKVDDQKKKLIEVSWDESNLNEPVKDIEGAYLKLHLISYKFVLPNSINLDGIFNVLPNVAWTNIGPIAIEDIDKRMNESKNLKNDLYVRSLDKFPCLTDYIIPKNVRIADTSRVRLGAYLSEGTTIMHEGFVNFNAGTLGKAMIEGRISSGVVIGDNSDLGGGASTMGTLSGGNEVKISVGKNCLLGANSGLGIPIGDNCTLEAGLYLTAGTKVLMLNKTSSKVVKASELSGSSDLLFYRDSTNGQVIAKMNTKVSKLNEDLHIND